MFEIDDEPVPPAFFPTKSRPSIGSTSERHQR